jgi:hypothetical protein
MTHFFLQRGPIILRLNNNPNPFDNLILLDAEPNTDPCGNPNAIKNILVWVMAILCHNMHHYPCRNDPMLSLV